MITSIANIGSVGLNTDIDGSELPINGFSDGQNFVIRNNKVLTLNGYKLIASAPVNFYAGLIRFIQSASGSFYLLMGRTKAYVYNGVAWSDITSVAGYGSLGINAEFNWHSCKLGDIPIVNNPSHYPEYWSPQDPSQILQPLKFNPASTWSTNGTRAKVIRSHKNFLFALGMTEVGVELPTTYRWSHPAGINGLPYTWDEADLGAIAGKASVSGSGGALVDGLSLRDSFCLYSENSITILDYIGGEFIWKARLLSPTHGLLARGAIVEAMGVHYFMSSTDILANDGNSIRSILTSRVKTKLQNELDLNNAQNTFAHINQLTKEIWFCYPKTGSLLSTGIIIYNYETQLISFRDISLGISDIAFGPIFSTPNTWDTSSGSWDSDNTTWGSGATSTINSYFVGTNNETSSIYTLEDSTSGQSYNTIITRTNLSLAGLDTIAFVTAIYPRLRSIGTIKIEIGTQEFFDRPITWKPSVIFDPDTTLKVDFRATGKLHAWRISSVADNPFILLGLDIEFITAGKR